MTDDMLKADELWARMVKAREEYKKNKNKPKSVCVSCEKELEWAGFAYNQELCWDCVVKNIFRITNNIDTLSMFWEHKEEDIKLIKWLAEMAATNHNLKRPGF